MADGPATFQTSPMGGGHTCAICRVFVPSGTTHFCCGSPYQRAAEVKWDRMSDVRIADALERIAKHLVELTEIVHKVVVKLAEAEEHNTGTEPK